MKAVVCVCLGFAIYIIASCSSIYDIKSNMLRMNSLFCLSEINFLSPLFLKVIFTGYRLS